VAKYSKVKSAIRAKAPSTVLWLNNKKMLNPFLKQTVSRMTKKNIIGNKIPFFWAFMIVYLAYIFLGYLIAYNLNNNFFFNDELSEGIPRFMVFVSVFTMVIPGIAAHYVYEKAQRNWYIWFCPLVLMVINGAIWLIPFHNSLRDLGLFPLACVPLFFGINLDLSQVNIDLVTFVVIVLLPSIVYAICIFLAKLFARKPKAEILE
jgi:hypothetical protein